MVDIGVELDKGLRKSDVILTNRNHERRLFSCGTLVYACTSCNQRFCCAPMTFGAGCRKCCIEFVVLDIHRGICVDERFDSHMIPLHAC